MISDVIGVFAVVEAAFARCKSRALMTFRPGMRLASFSIARFWICRTRSLLTFNSRLIACKDRVCRNARTRRSRGVSTARSAGLGSGCRLNRNPLALGFIQMAICHKIYGGE